LTANIGRARRQGPYIACCICSLNAIRCVCSTCALMSARIRRTWNSYIRWKC
jgi:hypothetical protein